MFRRIFCLLLLAPFLLLMPADAAGSEIVWQIGTPDRSFLEFHHLGNRDEYLMTFPMDTTFTVGKSDPAKDFAWIQPGPVDYWCGRREHPVTLSFDMPPGFQGIYQLQLDLVDVEPVNPPIMSIDINGRQVESILQPGSGDITLIRPEKGKPQPIRLIIREEQLKPSGNRIVIVGKKGSWVLYDALTLSRLPEDTAPPLELTVRPSIFFVEREGRLKQEFEVSLSGLLSNTHAEIAVSDGGEIIETALFRNAQFGLLTGRLHITPTDADRRLTVRSTSGMQAGELSITQRPQRKWRVYCAPSTHTDIGFTDMQDNVVELHNRNTDVALQLIREFPLYHWNLESSWAAQMWLQDNPPRRHSELFKATADRRLGIEAGYLNMLTGLCSGEELIRNLYCSARLNREAGVPFESFTLTDAPSHVWSLPGVLAGAGIRYASFGINGIRAPLLKRNLHHKSPFWWEARDGGRVLTWFTPGYSQAGRIGLNEGPDRMRKAIEADLYWWDHRQDYPYDAILLHGAYADNVAIGRSIAESLTAYSSQYVYPRIILSANSDFFKYIEANFADAIPVVRGCGGSWWEDGAASSAFETAVNRKSHQGIIAAEAVWAVAVSRTGMPVPQHEFNRVWDQILLYDEHTWGAHNSTTAPTSDSVQRQWAVKSGYALDAARSIRKLTAQGLDRLSSRVKVDADSLLVFNPSGFDRSGAVEAAIPRGHVVLDGGRPLPQQLIRREELQDTVALYVRDVPALGYRTYSLSSQVTISPPAPQRWHAPVLENAFYRVSLAPEGAGVASIIDKALNRELVDRESKYRVGQPLYVLGGGFSGDKRWWGPDPAQISINAAKGQGVEVIAHGPVFTAVRSKSSLPNFSSVVSEVILHENERRLDFMVRLVKDMTYDREAFYVAFPFVGDNPRFRYEIGGGHARPNEDQLPGACRDWFAVQRWVTVQTDGAAVIWTPVDTPLMTLCDLTPGRWLDELPITNGTIFAYAMNNYWFTNYKAGQDGDFTFHYSLTSDTVADAQTASVFGESVVQPMRTVLVQPNSSAADLSDQGSFCRIEPANVMLTAFKAADDGRGLIVRIQETAGRETMARVILDLDPVNRAWSCDLVERNRGPVEIAGNQITLPIKANSTATLRIE